MKKINLQATATRAPKGLNKKSTLADNAEMIAKIQSYQYKMFAEGKRSMLIVLQGLDAAGKDGVVRYIFSGMNPLGTKATSFRVPTKEEMSHDFLWRIHQEAPATGEVKIFNRSHYEDILVPTVEKLANKKTIENRYHQINNFEDILQENGTIILKFYLHISKEKQKEKLNERLTDPTKYWKHNIGDWDTRDNFDEYLDVYETIFAECNKPERHIIAADQNRYKINQICKIILKTFENMNLKWPALSPDQETAYLKAKAELAARNDAKENEKIAKKIAKQEAQANAKIKVKEKKKLEKERKKEEKAQQKAHKKFLKLQAKEEKLKKTEVALQTKEQELTEQIKTTDAVIKQTPTISKSSTVKTSMIKKPVSTRRSPQAKKPLSQTKTTTA